MMVYRMRYDSRYAYEVYQVECRAVVGNPTGGVARVGPNGSDRWSSRREEIPVSMIILLVYFRQD